MNLLRFIAALLVVLEHSRILFLKDWDEVPHNPLLAALYGITALGHSAVIIFFVLSGYWVGGSSLWGIKNETFSWKIFLTNRLVRLWIVLIPALLLTAGLDSFGMHFFGEMSTYRGDSNYQGVAITSPNNSPGAFLGTLFFLGAIRTQTFGTDVALWSISYEFWMYILGSIILVGIYRSLKFKIFAFVLILIFVAALGSAVLTYLPIWFLGVLVARYKSKVESFTLRMGSNALRATRLLTFCLLFSAAVFFRGMNTFPLYATEILTAIFAALFIGTITNFVPNNNYPGQTATRISVLSEFSFTMYAIHVPVLVLLASFLGVSISARWEPNFLNWMFFTIIVVFVITFSWLFSLATERQTSKVRHFILKRL